MANFKKYLFIPGLLMLLLLFASCQGNASTTETTDNTNQSDTSVIITDTSAETIQTSAETIQTSAETIQTSQETTAAAGDSATKLLYMGHASLRLASKDGTVIYVDPYAGEGYDVPADIILVTHQHDDHNQVNLVTQKDGCTVITNVEALAGGTHNSFSVKGIDIQSVEAGNNPNHDITQCVGYIITVDGIKVYVAGDTSKTDQMSTFTDMGINYALFPCDGSYNMDAAEAAECAKLVNAKHNIPYHTKPGELFDMSVAENFDAPNKLVVQPGEEIVLTSD